MTATKVIDLFKTNSSIHNEAIENATLAKGDYSIFIRKASITILKLLQALIY